MTNSSRKIIFLEVNMTDSVKPNLPVSAEKTSDSSTSKIEVMEVIRAVFGCKWSLSILALIRRGICRPGEIEHNLDGLTSRVKNYYFRRMIELGLLKKIVYPEIPPHVEYHLTAFAWRLIPIIDSIEELQCELNQQLELFANTDSNS